jgi:sister-chromatid-cohesion protein PDS5
MQGILKCLTKFSVDESFVKGVVHILKSQVSGVYIWKASLT